MLAALSYVHMPGCELPGLTGCFRSLLDSPVRAQPDKAGCPVWYSWGKQMRVRGKGIATQKTVKAGLACSSHADA